MFTKGQQEVTMPQGVNGEGVKPFLCLPINHLHTYTTMQWHPANRVKTGTWLTTVSTVVNREPQTIAVSNSLLTAKNSEHAKPENRAQTVLSTRVKAALVHSHIRMQ
jgi:hypothetical protein